jgi:hypothetical protein
MNKKSILKATCSNPALFAAMARKKDKCVEEKLGIENWKIWGTGTGVFTWEKKFLKNKLAALVIDKLVENQSCLAKVTSDENKEGEVIDLIKFYKEQSPELVRQIYSLYNFVGHHIINFCAMLAPTTFISHNNDTESISLYAKSRLLKTGPGSMLYVDWHKEDLLDCVTQDIGVETTREILLDLRNNAKHTVDTNGTNHSTEWGICAASDMIFDKTGVKPNWMVAPPEIVDNLEYTKFDTLPSQSSLSIKFKGIWHDGGNELLLLEDPLLPMKQILLGYKGDVNDHHQSPYYYCGYIPLTLLPGFNNWRFMTRYGKCLIKGGDNYYAKVKIS